MKDVDGYATAMKIANVSIFKMDVVCDQGTR